MTDKEAIKSLKWKVEYAKEIGEHHVDGVYVDALALAVKALEDGKQREWIPITYRPLTEEERIELAEHYGVEYCDTLETFDCPMPEDGQEILISTSWGVVEDVADNDIDGEGFICYGLATNGDWDGVEAWMPKPERYKKEGAK